MEYGTQPKVSIDMTKIAGESPMVVSEIFDNTLYTGFFGILDSARIMDITDDLLLKIEEKDTNYLIIDLSNVDIIDSAVAAHLIKVVNTLKLVGTKTYFCGVKAIVAQSMINAGIGLEETNTFRSLKYAIKKTLEDQKLKIVPIDQR